jgi:hypothetical protein
MLLCTCNTLQLLAGSAVDSKELTYCQPSVPAKQMEQAADYLTVNMPKPYYAH